MKKLFLGPNLFTVQCTLWGALSQKNYHFINISEAAIFVFKKLQELYIKIKKRTLLKKQKSKNNNIFLANKDITKISRYINIIQ